MPEQIAHRPWAKPVVAFLFTGQGSQFPAMTAALHRESAAYRHHLDEADAALRPYTDRSVRDLVLGGDTCVDETEFAQPALFAVGYALARTLTAAGAGPAAVLGHSVGEFAAAVIAGALTLDEGARLVAARGRLMQALPAGGGMLAVKAARGELHPHLDAHPQVAVGAVNGPQDTVLSGPREALAQIAEALTEDGIRCRMLDAPLAFHSPLVRPALDRFHAAAATTEPAAPGVPMASTLHGRLLGRQETTDAGYWVRQAAEPVLFADALADLDATIAPHPPHRDRPPRPAAAAG
ncbi:hypothetical protein GCM10020000_52260 [Streptomyces olivoverticillatus]